MEENAPQRHRLIVRLVVRGIHERKRMFAGNLPKLIDESDLVLELDAVAALEPLASGRVVSEPVSQPGLGTTARSQRSMSALLFRSPRGQMRSTRIRAPSRVNEDK